MVIKKENKKLKKHKIICESIGGYVENNYCIIREIYFKTINKSYKDVDGIIKTIVLSKKESMKKLGVIGNKKLNNWIIYKFPIISIQNLSFKEINILKKLQSCRVKDRKEYNLLTNEQKKEHLNQHKNWFVNLSLNERKRLLIKKKENKNDIVNNMNKLNKNRYLEEQKVYNRNKENKRLSNMDDKQKEEYNLKRKFNFKRIRNKVLKRNREKYNNLNPIEKKEYLKYASERNKKSYAKKIANKIK